MIPPMRAQKAARSRYFQARKGCTGFSYSLEKRREEEQDAEYEETGDDPRQAGLGPHLQR